MAITLTERAASHVRRHIDTRGTGVGLRLGVKRTGCSGLAYVVNFADEVAAGDQVFESSGVKVIVDPESLEYIDGTEVDYVREGLNEAFRFRNPNASSECGCGESFNIQ
jgi:iron-sulfur cluster assembly protein